MTNREIATRIFNKLKAASAPGDSTWGDQLSELVRNYPHAYASLFGTEMRPGYKEDMIEDIVKILDEAADGDVLPSQKGVPIKQVFLIECPNELNAEQVQAAVAKGAPTGSPLLVLNLDFVVVLNAFDMARDALDHFDYDTVVAGRVTMVGDNLRT